MNAFRSITKRNLNRPSPILNVNPMRQNSLYGSNNNQFYKECIETLNSLQTNAQVLQKLKKNKSLGQKNNIEETKKYLIRTGVSLEQLEKKLSVIHVSGTKGKGSTCALCESILHFHGYKTGFYSSPHLVAVRERIRINGTPLSEAAFVQYFWKVYNRLSAGKDHENDMPSYFKFLTVMAYNVFLEENVDVAIIEVGIGGKYDCTNIFLSTPVVGISSLGLDHTSLLGNTIELIAEQKGGIMKPRALAFTSPQQPSALQVLKECASKRQCSLWEVPPLSRYDWQGYPVAVGLKGDVQDINASLALQLSHAWINKDQLDRSRSGFLGFAKSFKIDKATAEGLKQCSWPGRYQTLTRTFIHGTCRYYLDGAHTKDSIDLCAKWFLHTTSNNQLRNQCRFTLVYNVTGDRDPEELLAPLVECHFDTVLFCPNVLSTDAKHSDLANLMVTSEKQLERCESNRKTWLSLEKQMNVHTKELKTFPSVSETLKYIESREGEQHILVSGSLHLVGTVLTALDPNLTTFSKQHSSYNS